MPRPPPFKPLQLGDARLDRLQENLAAYLAQLDDQVAGLVSPLVLPATRDAQVTDEVLVDYRGPGGHVIAFPFAAAAGKGRGRFLHVLNNGGGSIILAASGKDTIQGLTTLALPAGSALLAMSNGERRWGTAGTQVAPTVELPWFSPVDYVALYASLQPSGVQTANGSFTVGDKFTNTRPLTATGVRFYWNEVSPGDSRTIRATIWGQAVALVTVDITVSTSGVYEAIFATPFPCNQYQGYAATIWDTTSPGANARYTYSDTSAAGPFGVLAIVDFFASGPFTITQSSHRSAAGNAVPSTSSSNIMFPVEPIFAPFSLE